VAESLACTQSAQVLMDQVDDVSPFSARASLIARAPRAEDAKDHAAT